VELTALRREVAGLDETRALAARLGEQLVARRGAENGRGAPHAPLASLAEELRTRLERLQRSLTTDVDRVGMEIAQVQGAADRLRLLPASVLFASLERGARDAAQATERGIEFESAGGETRLHAHVLAALRDALLHVVRNAVAHGIEPEAERRAAGKPPLGRIELRVEQRGRRVTFACRDDGRGIDVDAVRRAAVRRGLLSAAQVESPRMDEAIRLILNERLTTTPTVTEVAGRGIGLDVVRETTARLGGELDVRSEPGRGTTIEISVPVSLSSTAALVVDVGGNAASIPLVAVRRTIRVTDAEVARSTDGESIVCAGAVIPFLRLDRVLRAATSASRDRGPWSAVLVQGGAGVAAVAVDRLLGIGNVVVRPLPSLVEADPVVAGATLDGAGNPQPVLDPDGLVAAAHAGPCRGAAPRPPTRRRVLVVDDSLTTRMLEQAILESAGYDVDLATSAEDALAQARERPYDLFLVDVEMPGMDGFEFVACTRADPAFRDIPSILVTSRGSPEDRSRGTQVGARAYIVKSEFNQSHLLQTIRGLVG
jgi:two-component system chemotaxis sensor kinase CheA